jgi:hypothetical protein
MCCIICIPRYFVIIITINLFYLYAHNCSYQVDLDVKKLIDEDGMEDETKRKEAKKDLKKMFEARYMNQADSKATEKAKLGASYFFKKLRF